MLRVHDLEWHRTNASHHDGATDGCKMLEDDRPIAYEDDPDTYEEDIGNEDH